MDSLEFAEQAALLSVRLAVLKFKIAGNVIHAVPVRGIPRLRTFIGTTRLRSRGSSLKVIKTSGCFSCIVGTLDMVEEAALSRLALLELRYERFA